MEYSQQLNFNLNVSTNANMSNCICNCRIITSSDNEERELDNFDFAFTEGVYLKEDIVLKYDSLINNCRNIITILVEDKLNSNIKCKHMFPIYVDIDDEKSIDDFDIKFDYELPNENLSIYKGESIKDLQVDIYNNTLENGIFNLKVLTQDVQDRNNTIAEEYNIKNIELMSGKMKSIKLGDICFDEKYFSRKGAIRVKFILTHKSGISSREIGEKVMEPYFTILFETEQIDNSLKLPIKISQRPYENTHVKFDLNELSDKRYELIFNTNYSLWKLIGEDTNRKKMYTIEELFRQIVNIKLEKRDFSIINRTEKQVDDLSAHELHQLIELVVNEYVGNFFEVR